jgi:UDP-N-acetylglucosamine diphosphorylase/glucosamine-1-phosphate N-acetyltransferase
MRMCVFEDDQVIRLNPLALARPVFDLWCGACSLLDRQRRHFRATEVGLVVRSVLAGWCRFLHPGHPVNERGWLGGETVLFVNGRWLPPSGNTRPELDGPRVALVGDQIAYAVLPGADCPAAGPEQLAAQVRRWKQDLPATEACGHMIDYPWDLVRHNAEALDQDYLPFQGRPTSSDAGAGPAVIGPREALFIDPGACVEPLAVVDTTGGAVVIDRGAVVQAFSRLEGPCYIGPESQVLGARVKESTIGPHCRVGGEIEASILQGYSNKYHDGFLGHSYVGEWVNLAAGTQVSDLRNDYAEVTVTTVAGEEIDTGLLKVGAFLADHTRTGVGALLDCGTLAGPFAQLLPGGTYLPRVVPPFCTCRSGQLRERVNFRKLFAAAAAAMGRRGQCWTEAHAEFFLDLFDVTALQFRALLDNAVGGRQSTLSFRA